MHTLRYISLPIRSIFLAAALAMSTGVCAEPFTKAQMVALSYGADIRLYKMAFVAAQRANAQKLARENPGLSANPEAATKYIDGRVEDAIAFANGATARGTWIETLSKEAAPALCAAATKDRKCFFSKSFTDKGVEFLLDVFTRRGVTPTMDPDAVVNIAAYVLASAKDPTSPDHQFSKSMVKDFLGLDPAISYDLLPAVQAQVSEQRFTTFLEKLSKKLDDAGDDLAKQAAIMKDMQTNEAELLEILNTTLADSRAGSALTKGRFSPAQLEDIRRAERYKERLRQVSLCFGTMSGISLLLNDPGSAERFHRAAALTEGISAAIETTLTKSLAESPILYANVYVGVAVLAMNLFQASEEANADTAIMEQLQQISQQIEELRQEMHDRFDVLDYKVDHYFEKIYFSLAPISYNIVALHSDVDSLRRLVSSLGFEILSGLRFAWENRIIDQELTCFATARDGIFEPLSVLQTLLCRNFFVRIASAPESLSTGVDGTSNDQLKEVGAVSKLELDTLQNMYARLDPDHFSPDVSVLPSNWALGTRRFLDFFEAHPERLEYADHSGLEDHPELELTTLIQSGESIVRALDTLALDPVDNGEFQLKQSLFDGILDEYQNEALAAIFSGSNLAKTFAGNGPKPALGTTPAPPHDNKYAFFVNPSSKTIGFCKGASKAQTGSVKVLGASHAGTLSYLKAFNKASFRWDSSFFNLIPNSVLWAARMDFENTLVFPCFRKINTPIFEVTSAGLRYQWVFELEFWALSDGSNGRPFLVSKATMDSGSKLIKGIGFSAIGGQTWLDNIWNNQRCSDVCSFKWRNNVWQHGDERFSPVPIEDGDADPLFRFFEERFNAYLSRQAEIASSALEQSYDINTKVDARRVLFLVAALGLDRSRPEVSDFIAWLSDEDALPSAIGLARAGLTFDVSDEVLVQLVDERVSVGRDQIKKLAESKRLAPRTFEFSGLVSQLQNLKKTSPTYSSQDMIVIPEDQLLRSDSPL